MKRFLAIVFAVALGAALTATSALAAGESLKEKTKDTAESAKEKTKDAAESVKEKTKDAAESVKEKAQDVKERMTGHKKDRSADHMAATGKDDVMAAQQALKDKGHDPGTIDGRMGPQTRTALKDYQKAEGLKVTGRLDNETRAKLGLATRTSKMERGTATSPSASPATTSPSATSTTGPSGAPQPAGTPPSSSQSPPAPGTSQR